MQLNLGMSSTLSVPTGNINSILEMSLPNSGHQLSAEFDQSLNGKTCADESENSSQNTRWIRVIIGLN